MTRSFLLVPILAALAAHAHAQDGFYVEGFGGASAIADTELDFGATSPEEAFSAGPVAGGAVGFDYAGSPWRSELEFTYRSAGPDDLDGDFASTALAVNGYYEFGAAGAVRPYLGAGLGYVTEIDLDVEGGPDAGEYADRGGALWQAMAGIRFPVSDRLTVAGELRYFDAGRRTLDGDAGSVRAEYSGVEATVALAVRF